MRVGFVDGNTNGTNGTGGVERANRVAFSLSESGGGSGGGGLHKVSNKR